MNLKLALNKNKKEIDEFLSRFLEEKKLEAEKFDSELSSHVDLIKKQILRSGKRVRPFILGLSYKLASGTNDNLRIQLGSAVELIHQYFLIHDDIVDEDEKRYGGPSLHKIISKKMGDDYSGVSMGMIGGDYVNSLAHELISDLDTADDKKVEILKIIHQTIRETVAGWQIHYFQNKIPIQEADEKRYLKGMELVSAKYTFEMPSKLGLVLKGDYELIEFFRRFSFLVGMAFQIQDDILGVFGDTKKTGKPAGNDLREGKKTLLILRAYKNATNEQKLYIKDNLGNNIEQKQLDELRDIITQTGSLNYSTNLAKSYIQEAKKLVLNLNMDKNELDLLRELADFVVYREF